MKDKLNKKEYISPKMKNYTLKCQNRLLEGSPEGPELNMADPIKDHFA